MRHRHRYGAAACLFLGMTAADAAFAADPRAAEQFSVADGAVTVAGPPGYCVDLSEAKQDADGTAFLILGSCAAMAEGLPSPVAPAMVLTVAIAAHDSAKGVPGSDLATLEGFFASEQGLAALSRSGHADNVTLLHSEVKDGILYLDVEDRGPASDTALEPRYCRAVFILNGRLVTLSAFAHAGSPVPPETQHEIVARFVARMREVNGGKD